MIKLDLLTNLMTRLQAKRPLIQVVLGPRQVGKTTTVDQLIADLPKNQTYHYATADAVFRSDWTWIERQWQEALTLGSETILILDEIQKIDNWSEIVKKLWDESKRKSTNIKLVLLGSSSLALQIGLSESLTGRFELMRAYHWNLLESQKAFQYSLSDHLILGGYPALNQFKNDEQRCLDYIKSSIVETVIDKDILQLRHITRPALFKQVFELLCSYPAMEISLRKLVGQLQDPGSIETIKHYIELLEGAFLVKTLQKYSTNPIQKKSSSPKILPLCPALCTFIRAEFNFSEELRGRLFELLVGTDLLRLGGEIFYWRQDQMEVDYVFKKASQVIAIEVKSGRKKSLHGLTAFKENFPKAKCVTITMDRYDAFLKNPLSFLLSP